MRPIVGLKRSDSRSILGMLDRVAGSIDIGLLILNGQGKVKTTASIGYGVYPNLTVVGADDALTQRQSNAVTVF